MYNDWSEFILFHGGGTEKSDDDGQIHGTDFKVDFSYEIKAFHWSMWLIYIHPKYIYIYQLVRAIITIDITTHHDSISKYNFGQGKKITP